MLENLFAGRTPERTIPLRKTTIHDRLKLEAIRALDQIEGFEDPEFVLVVSGRKWIDEDQGYITVPAIVASDERLIPYHARILAEQAGFDFGFEEEGDEDP